MDQPGHGHGAAVRFPPPILPIVTIVAGLLLGRFWPLGGGYELPVPDRYVIGGAVAALAILVLVIWPALLFKKTGQDPKPWTDTPEVVFDGPYRFTRNPMYLGMLVFCLGFAIILSEAWILVLTPLCAWLIYHLAIRHEEAYLDQKFGEPYRDYCRKVRRWL